MFTTGHRSKLFIVYGTDEGVHFAVFDSYECKRKSHWRLQWSNELEHSPDLDSVNLYRLYSYYNVVLCV